MKRTLTFIFIALLFLLACPVSRAQVKRPMTPADLLRVANVGDAQVSPDGEFVAYTVSAVDRETTRTSIWLARIARQSPTAARSSAPLLSNDWSASNPRWSPDSRRIAFIATREGQTGIYQVALADRQPRLVASLREAGFFITYAGETFAWAPDSRRIAFISASDDADEAGGAGVSVAASRNEKRNDPRVVDRIQYKTRTGFSDRARTHVWLVDADAGGQPHQLTNGSFYDHALTWNPQGNEIAFLSNREPDPEANNNSDIFAVDVQGRLRQITDTRGCEYEPQWSPDGRHIAYTATTRDTTTIDSVAEDTHVWVIESGGGRARDLTAAQDRRARSPRWSPDSRSIYFLAGDRGRSLIYHIGIDESTARAFLLDEKAPADMLALPPNVRLPFPFQVSGFSISARIRTPEPGAPAASGSSRAAIAYTLSSAVRPQEVYVGLPGTRLPLLQVSAHNDTLGRTTAFVEPEEIRFRSFDGLTIQGWLMKPVGWRDGQRYPLILSIHGGPHGMSGYGFNPTFQAYAAGGYAIFYMNPRGSSGYGQRFSDGTLREWGGGDYRDLMMGVDEVLRTRSWIDTERMGVTGGSYGGFMTNWIITQTPRFKAAVASASVSNLVSFYATSLYQDLIHAEFGGFPWDDFDLLWRWSPLRYVKQAQTPTLFIHGEQDNDVHITQAEEMYMALRRRGIETVLVRYPREGHGLREARHRVDALERTLAWFDKYLR